ncbi:3-oxoacyl-[acyl-carrier-protein] reductase FabG-like isoform X3 [Haemaphysalis longicornis]
MVRKIQLLHFQQWGALTKRSMWTSRAERVWRISSRLSNERVHCHLAWQSAVQAFSNQPPWLICQKSSSTKSWASTLRCAAWELYNNDGALVTIASNWAHSGSPQYSAYAASKAATVAFTKSLALELAQQGIRCNCVLPSYTDTPMTATNSAQDKARDAAKSAMRRAARPDEVAHVVAFLCGPRSSYVNGSTIDVNGGAMI